jgi:hypothetical protein
MEHRSKRRSLRAPVSIDVRCETAGGATLKGRAVNLGTEGIFVKVAEPIDVREKVTVEFLLPGTLNSIQLVGEVVWSHPYSEDEGEESFHVAGIKFADLGEPYRSLLRDYTFKMLDSEELVRSQGILQVLDDIRNLPSMDRLKAYNILIKKGSGPLLE